MRAILFIIFMFLAIWFTSVNYVKFKRGVAIHWANFAIMSASLTMVIVYFMGIW